MNLDEYVWMGMDGYGWVCMGMYGYVWVWMGYGWCMDGYVWVWMAYGWGMDGVWMGYGCVVWMGMDGYKVCVNSNMLPVTTRWNSY